METARPFAKGSRAFTLLEMLVAVGVFSLLIFFVAQFADGVAFTSSNSSKHKDADNEARMVLDRMALDFARMVKRKDVDLILAKHSGNDALFFYSEVPAYYDTSATLPQDSAINTVSVVGYRINASFTLDRYARGLEWSGAAGGAGNGAVVFLTYPAGGGTPDPLSCLGSANTVTAKIGTLSGGAGGAYSDGDDAEHYHTIGEQVFRLEICFLLTDGTIALKPVTNPSSVTNNLAAARAPTASDDSAAGYAVGSRWYDTANSRGYVCARVTKGSAVWSPIGVRDVAAVIVAIAVLDPKSQALASPSGAWVSALGDLEEADLAAAPYSLMAAKWLNAVTGPGFAAATGMPKSVAGQVRVYQRYFYLAH
jgi:prepilin-type N-terminal cleavage/methylation domain-containing protein